MNAFFLAMASGAGMTSAIMNPLHEEELTGIMAADVLMNHDKDCRAWIRKFREPAAPGAEGEEGGRRERRRRRGERTDRLALPDDTPRNTRNDAHTGSPPGTEDGCQVGEVSVGAASR